jgi:hypothetical protein
MTVMADKPILPADNIDLSKDNIGLLADTATMSGSKMAVLPNYNVLSAGAGSVFEGELADKTFKTTLLINYPIFALLMLLFNDIEASFYRFCGTDKPVHLYNFV